jgi:O-antigen/teichoic acid export membrane protein
MTMSAAFLVSALVQFLLGLVVAWLLGPVEFGVYALVVAAGILLQTLCFEWLRLAATRFFHAGAEGFRQGLLLAFAIASLMGLVVSGLAGAGTRGLLSLDRAAIFLIPALAIAAGFLDLLAALLRARFRETDYARVLLVRNLGGIVLVPGAALLFGRAEAAGLALLVSLVLAGLYAFARERDAARAMAPPSAGASDAVTPPAPAATTALQDTASEPQPIAEAPPSFFGMIGYAGPIVVTNVLYLALFFGIRSWAALTGGLALAGQVSLALDFVLKLFTTIGSALDLWLFQRAVQRARERGEAEGRAQLHHNSGLILALLLAIAVGLALVIEAFEPLLVRPDFRGAFAGAVLMLTPGVFLYALIQFALHPYAQLAQRTVVLVITAMVVFAVAASGGLLLRLLPAGLAGLAIVLGLAMAAGCVVLARLSPGYEAPLPAYLGRLALAILALAVPVTLVQQQWGGVVGGFAAVAVGAVAFLATAWFSNLAEIRRWRR